MVFRARVIYCFTRRNNENIYDRAEIAVDGSNFTFAWPRIRSDGKQHVLAWK